MYVCSILKKMRRKSARRDVNTMQLKKEREMLLWSVSGGLQFWKVLVIWIRRGARSDIAWDITHCLEGWRGQSRILGLRLRSKGLPLGIRRVVVIQLRRVVREGALLLLIRVLLGVRLIRHRVLGIRRIVLLLRRRLLPWSPLIVLRILSDRLRWGLNSHFFGELAVCWCTLYSKST